MFSTHRHTLLYIAALLLQATCVRSQDSVRFVPSRCAGADCIIPRVCDTLDAHAWRYFNFVPEWKGVTGASLLRNDAGAELRATTVTGPRRWMLSKEETELLGAFIADYERQLKDYDGGIDPTWENLSRVIAEIRFGPLFTCGLLGPHPIASSSPGDAECGIRGGGNDMRGMLLYVSDRALYLWQSSEEWNPQRTSSAVRRIPFTELASLTIFEHGNFGSGFRTGGLIAFAALSTLGSSVGQGSTSGNYYSAGAGFLAGVLGGTVGGFIVGIVSSAFRWSETIPIPEAGQGWLDVQQRLHASQAFPFDAPPELRAFADSAERMWIDSVSGARAQNRSSVVLETPSTSDAEAQASATSREAASAALLPPVSFELAANYGWNFYHFFGEGGKDIGIWSGVEAAMPLRTLRSWGSTAGLSLRPHVALATSNVRVGIDLLLHATPRWSFLAGLDAEYVFDEMGGYQWDYWDGFDQHALRDLLFLPIGIQHRWDHVSFEMQYRFSLGTPLYTDSTFHRWYGMPLLHRHFSALLFRMAWRVW